MSGRIAAATMSRGRLAGLALLAAGAACGGGESARPATDSSRRDTGTVAGVVRGCGGDGAGSGDTSVRVHPVNRGTYGMIARTRWAASPDGCTLLAVVDPASVEAEPLTNGALIASERGPSSFTMTFDDVWDVAPNPAWTAVAYGRGWILSGGEADSVPRAKWEALARQTGLDATTLERQSFPASGMAYARGVALAYVRAIAPSGQPEGAGVGGWRVRWRGDTLFVGGAPEMVQDHMEPAQWTMHPPPDRAAVVVPASFAPGPQRWAEGPLVQLGVPNDSGLAALRVLKLAGGSVARSQQGTIYLERPGRPARVVGRGALLAATLGGRYLLALAPAPRAREHEPREQLVVYEVLE